MKTIFKDPYFITHEIKAKMREGARDSLPLLDL